MSRSGILLRMAEPLGADTPIELVVELPAVAGEEPARVVCSGRIVSASAAEDEMSGALVSATIAYYRFDRSAIAFDATGSLSL